MKHNLDNKNQMFILHEFSGCVALARKWTIQESASATRIRRIMFAAPLSGATAARLYQRAI
jgi:hypothetical protein